MIVAGVDIGSVATKAVVLADGRAVGKAVARTGVDHAAAGRRMLEAALADAGVGSAQVERVVTTGYGRRSAKLGAAAVTEITAAGRGAGTLKVPWGPVRTVVDLGGQDSKVIVLDERGAVADFAMNDKCAAGTGRFLEVMAGVLGVTLAEMGELSLAATDPVAITATCAVFAESEVVSLIAQGRKPADILAGVHAAIAGRLAGMVYQVDGGRVVFIGGGAKNQGVGRALKEALGGEVFVPPDPEYVVALGAALVAADQLTSQGK